MLLLRHDSLVDEFLRCGDFGAQAVAVGGAQVALRGYGGNGGAHFGRFGRFFAERVGVGLTLLREDLEILLFETLVLYVFRNER